MNAMERERLSIESELCAAEIRGSLDHAAPFEQMQIVNEIMPFYFGVADWLAARNKRRPGLYRVGS